MIERKDRLLGPRTLLTAFGIAVLLTAFSMVIKTQYCICGPGWGWPFPVWHVVCGTKFGDSFMLDPILLAFDLVVWTLAAIVFLFFRAFAIHHKRNKETAEQHAGQVSSEAAPSASPNEPSA